MRIRLKGINSITKKLANGTPRTYWYAWKGGPALRGEPGTPEFVASYNEAVARKVVPPRGTLLSVMQSYQLSAEFHGLAEVTRKGYVWHIKRIENEFGDFPLAALTDRRTRGILMAWRDRVAASSGRRVADYCWAVLARILSWALDRGLVLVNPCARGGRLHRVTRRDKIWTADDEAALPPTRGTASASAAVAGAVDRATARRPHAPALVGLRRHPHPAAAVKDRRARRHPGRRAIKGDARRHAEALDDDPDESHGATVAAECIRVGVDACQQARGHHRPHLQ